MKDKNKEQLANEPEKMRQRIAQLEKEVTERRQAEEELQKSELRYRLLTENVTDVIWTMDMNLRFTYISPSVTRRYGYSVEEAMASPIEENLTPSSFKDAMKVFEEEMSIEKMEKKDLFRPRTLEVEQYRKDGSTVWSELEIAFLRDADGQAIGIVGVARDITERKRAEEEVARTRAYLEHSLASSPDGVVLLDKEGKTSYVNPAFLSWLGRNADDFIGKTILEISPPIMTPETTRVIVEKVKTQMETGGAVSDMEIELIDKDGKKITISYSASEIRDNKGNILGQVGFMRDITKRKRAEEALRDSEGNYRLLVDNFSDPLTVYDSNGLIILMNIAGTKIFGLMPEDVVGKSLHDFFPDTADVYVERARRIFESGVGLEFEDEVPLPSGNRWFYSNIQPIKDTSGKVISVQNISYDITERRRADEELRKSEGKYRSLIDNLIEPLTVYDSNGRILLINVTGAKNLGSIPEDVVGKSLYDFFPDKADVYVERARRIFESGVGLEFEDEVPLPSGNRWFYSNIQPIKDTSGKVISVQNISYDITERRRAEEALRESEERYKAIFNYSLFSVYVCDLKGNFLDINDAALDLLGYTREEIQSLNFAALLDEEELPIAQQILADVKRTGFQGKTVEFKWRIKDGDYVLVETESAIINQEGKPYAIQGIAKDITDRKKAEEALQESEERYRTVLETIEEGYYEVDLAGNFTFFNDSLCRIIGCPCDEMMGTNNRQYMDDDTAKAVYEVFNDVYQTGEPARAFGWEVIRKDGIRIFVEASTSLMRGPSGEPVGFRGIIRDITERRRAEEALRESEEKYRNLFEGASDGIFTMELTGEGAIFTDCNSKALTIFGCNLEEIIGKSPLDFSPLVQPDGRSSEEKVKELAGAVTAGEYKFFEWSHRRLDGTTFEVEVALNRIDVGSRIYLQTIVRDITERKRAEEELKKSEEKLRVMFEAITDGIVVTDLRGIITDVNDVVVHMSGLSREKIIGHDGFALLPREDRDKIVEEGKRVIKENSGPGRRDYEVSPKVGIASTTNLILGTMHDSAGNPTGFVAIAQDITERKQMEEERERLLVELADKSEELEQLVFIASHDLRSPLVNIQGFAREIEQSLQEVRLSLEGEDIPSALKEKLAAPIGEDIADSLNYILTSSSKIDSMLSGLLKVSRLGKVSLTIEKINMKDLMAEVMDSFEFQTREAGVKLEVGRLPQCRGDRAQLNQVFSNLIDNALKFFDPERPGIIRISGRKEDRQAVYTVEDNGIGIAPENQKTVFQIFRRFAPMDTPGERLGLNIVRRILDRHGGKIWLESGQGKGCRFHVSLPIR